MPPRATAGGASRRSSIAAPRPLWDAALQELPATENIVDRLLRIRLKGANPDRDTLKKACDALARRGFSWEEIQAAAERIKNES